MKEYTMIYKHKVGGQQPSPEEMQKITQEWMDWMASMVAQNALAQRGNRLAMDGKILRPGNVVTDSLSVELKEAIVGYSILRVENEAAALAFAKGCPALRYGGSVEVKEVIPANP